MTHKIKARSVRVTYKGEIKISESKSSALKPRFGSDPKAIIMAPMTVPSVFNATSQDIEMLLAAQCHLGSKNLQVHMEPYLWKTRPDGINVINIGKTWYVCSDSSRGI